MSGSASVSVSVSKEISITFRRKKPDVCCTDFKWVVWDCLYCQTLKGQCNLTGQNCGNTDATGTTKVRRSIPMPIPIPTPMRIA